MVFGIEEDCRRPNNPPMSREAGFAYLFKKFPVFAQTFTAREVEGLARHGCRPDVYALQASTPSYQEGFEALRRRVRVLPAGWQLTHDILRAGVAGRLPASVFFSGGWIGGRNRRRREACWLGPRLRAGGIGHVHVHFTGPAARTAWWLRRDYGLSYSITAHANDFLTDADEPPGLEHLLNDAEFVVAVSDYSRALLGEKFPRARIVRVYNGMQFDIALPLTPVSPPLLVAVGRLVEKKGYHVLIEACRLLRARGVEFRCEIIGEGPLEAGLRTQIGDKPDVVLKGPRPQPEIRQALSRASVFVLPCVEEKSGGMDILPTVITEAMAASLPVVSTRLAGIPEMVVEGKTGWLVPPGDPVAVADAVQKLLVNPDKARAMGAAGRLHAEAIFADTVTIPQLSALLRSVEPARRETN
jgi:glycosyltransferase involved in cell wall biosynthesis